MSVRLTRIFIDEENKNHFPGDIIQGYIAFSVNEPIMIYTLTLGLYGTGKSTWVVGEGIEKSRVKGYEEYNSVFELIHTGDIINYPIGMYKIPFRIEIKKDIPQTYNGCNSHINYMLRAIMKTTGVGKYSSELITMTHEHPLIISTDRDLNKMVNARGFPICGRRVLCKGIFQQELGCWCSTLGQIIYQVYMTKQGFVPGQTIKMKVNVFNHATLFSVTMTVTLEQIIQNIHNNGAIVKTMSKIKILDTFHGELLLPGQECEKVITMKLPKHIDSSGCHDSGIFNIEYQLRFEFLLFSESTGLKTKKVMIPLMIGDVPLDLELWKDYRNKKGWGKPWNGRYFTHKIKGGILEFLKMKKIIRPTNLNITKLKKTRAQQKRKSMYCTDYPCHSDTGGLGLPIGLTHKYLTVPSK